MKIYHVNDPEFRPYGKIHTGYDTSSLVETLKSSTPMPESGVGYVPSEPALEALPAFQWMRDNVFGGMPVELGWCNGRNTRLNCLEYHRDSEIDMGADDFIMLLAREQEIEDGVLDTAKVKAFYCPAGVMAELYATTLHYAPCSAKKGQGFRVLIGLPRGTNEAKPDLTPMSEEDKLLRACNKWLLAHPESNEAKDGAYVGLRGENIDIADSI